MRAHHRFTVLVTGTCATGCASVLRSVSGPRVVPAEVVRPGGVAATPIDVGGWRVTTDVGDVGLVLVGVPGIPSNRSLVAAAAVESDVVCVLVDADAPGSHAEARTQLRHLDAVYEGPVVVAVNGAADVIEARRLAGVLGVRRIDRVMACRLDGPGSGRDVMVSTLEHLLRSFDAGASTTGREVA